MYTASSSDNLNVQFKYLTIYGPVESALTSYPSVKLSFVAPSYLVINKPNQIVGNALVSDGLSFESCLATFTTDKTQSKNGTLSKSSNEYTCEVVFSPTGLGAQHITFQFMSTKYGTISGQSVPVTYTNIEAKLANGRYSYELFKDSSNIIDINAIVNGVNPALTITNCTTEIASITLDGVINSNNNGCDFRDIGPDRFGHAAGQYTTKVKFTLSDNSEIETPNISVKITDIGSAVVTVGGTLTSYTDRIYIRQKNDNTTINITNWFEYKVVRTGEMNEFNRCQLSVGNGPWFGPEASGLWESYYYCRVNNFIKVAPNENGDLSIKVKFFKTDNASFIGDKSFNLKIRDYEMISEPTTGTAGTDLSEIEFRLDTGGVAVSSCYITQTNGTIIANGVWSGDRCKVNGVRLAAGTHTYQTAADLSNGDKFNSGESVVTYSVVVS